MKTIFDHTQSRILVIPQALYSMRDVKLLSQYSNSAIFYKSLEQNLRDIEFYTNTPCFIFIESSIEQITNSRFETISLTAGDSIFLPQGLNLHSDFVKETFSLKAFLVFFDDEIIKEYLSTLNRFENNDTDCDYLYLKKGQQRFSRYFASFHSEIVEESYLKIKFLELLHLINFVESGNNLLSLLSGASCLPPKKNLARLLSSVEILHLSVNDLAHISGRSLSSFNREFKATYKMTAKKWLMENRLARAKELLESEAHSVTDVAVMVGYSNVSHFIKQFKNRYEMTPKEIIKYQLMTQKR